MVHNMMVSQFQGTLELTPEYTNRQNLNIK